jgi:hypothetical protein
MLEVVSDEDARLRKLGIHIDAGQRDPALRAECVRISQRLHEARLKVVGLLPATDEVAIPPLAVQLGLALVELSAGGTVAFVDANVRWPAISQVMGEPARKIDGQSRELGLRQDAIDDNASFFETRWLSQSLALLTPPQAGGAGAGVPHLARLVNMSAELFSHIVIDLTGFDLLGEHLAAIDLCDGALIVARAGRTREDALLRMSAQISPERNLGVVLVG